MHKTKHQTLEMAAREALAKGGRPLMEQALTVWQQSQAIAFSLFNALRRLHVERPIMQVSMGQLNWLFDKPNARKEFYHALKDPAMWQWLIDCNKKSNEPLTSCPYPALAYQVPPAVWGQLKVEGVWIPGAWLDRWMGQCLLDRQLLVPCAQEHWVPNCRSFEKNDLGTVLTWIAHQWWEQLSWGEKIKYMLKS